jgi:hypothetical protein
MGDSGDDAPGVAEEADAGVGGRDGGGWKSTAAELLAVLAAAIEVAAGEDAAGSAAVVENSAGCAAAT